MNYPPINVLIPDSESYTTSKGKHQRTIVCGGAGGLGATIQRTEPGLPDPTDAQIRAIMRLESWGNIPRKKSTREEWEGLRGMMCVDVSF